MSSGVSSNNQNRFTSRDDDAQRLFSQLGRPLDTTMISDGLATLSGRITSPAYLRSMERHY